MTIEEIYHTKHCNVSVSNLQQTGLKMIDCCYCNVLILKGIPPLFTQETKAKSYEMIDVDVFPSINEIRTSILYYSQDYRPCSAGKKFLQKQKFG